MMGPILYYKQYKLLQEREADDDRYYWYYEVYEKLDIEVNEQHTWVRARKKIDMSWSFVDQDEFEMLVDMDFPTRKALNSVGPLSYNDIKDLYDRWKNDRADDILLGL